MIVSSKNVKVMNPEYIYTSLFDIDICPFWKNETTFPILIGNKILKKKILLLKKGHSMNIVSNYDQKVSGDIC